ncbi:MAG: PASTA domain-containing protein [Bacteroidales bacterium]|jgi:beta-lactam-binding protein with PASTA domain|nr:PASTA domain-containing protein [Bacteroidales bacterium]
MGLIKYIFSKAFLIQIAIAVAFVAIIITVSLYWLKSYTSHNESISVPDLEGLTLNEMKQVINDNNLRFVISDSIYLPNKKRGAVVGQNPAPESQVKENRNIFITINAVSPEKIKMPMLIGLSTRQARSIAERHGLIVDKLRYVQDEASNYVLNQYYRNRPIDPDTKIIKGSSITLICGINYQQSTTHIPDLFNNTYKQARNNILNASLNVGRVVYDKSVKTERDSITARIWKQDPASNRINGVRLGTKINIWLTADEEKINNISEIREQKEKQREEYLKKLKEEDNLLKRNQAYAN